MEDEMLPSQDTYIKNQTENFTTMPQNIIAF